MLEGGEADCDWKAEGVVVVERKFHVVMVGTKACACCFIAINRSSATEAAATALNEEDDIVLVGEIRLDEPKLDLLAVRIVALLLVAADAPSWQQEDFCRRQAECFTLCSGRAQVLCWDAVECAACMQPGDVGTLFGLME